MKNWMIVLACVAVFALAGCSEKKAGSDEQTLAGTSWACTVSEKVEGVEVAMTMTFHFKAGGIFEGTVNGTVMGETVVKETVSGTYSEEGDRVTMTVDGVGNQATVSGDRMTVYFENGSSNTFIRQ